MFNLVLNQAGSLSSIIAAAGVIYLLKEYGKLSSDVRKLKSNNLASLKSQLTEYYKRFKKNKKRISEIDLINIESLYREYKSLGGNGAIKLYVEEMEDFYEKQN